MLYLSFRLYHKFLTKYARLFVCPHACIGTFVVISLKNHHFFKLCSRSIPQTFRGLRISWRKKISTIFSLALFHLRTFAFIRAATITNRKVPLFGFFYSIRRSHFTLGVWLAEEFHFVKGYAQKVSNAKEQA